MLNPHRIYPPGYAMQVVRFVVSRKAGRTFYRAEKHSPPTLSHGACKLSGVVRANLSPVPDTHSIIA